MIGEIGPDPRAHGGQMHAGKFETIPRFEKGEDMSSLLDDSQIATQMRDRILAEMQRGEKVLIAADGHATSFDTKNYPDKYDAALIITNLRVLLAKPKSFGRADFTSISWRDVETVGLHNQGGLAVLETTGPNTHYGPNLWRLRVYPLGSKRRVDGPLDDGQLKLMELSMKEAFDAILEQESAQKEQRRSDSADAYEALKRRRDV